MNSYSISSVHDHSEEQVTINIESANIESAFSVAIMACFFVSTYIIPGQWFGPEQRAGQLHWQTFLVVLGFILGHAEQDSCSIGCYTNAKQIKSSNSDFHKCLKCIWDVLTNALITRVQQLSQGCSCSFSFNCLSSFFVLGQFTQHTCCNALDVLYWRVQQLDTRTNKVKSSLRTKGSPRCM